MLHGGSVKTGLLGIAFGVGFLIMAVVLQFNVRNIIEERAESLRGYPPWPLRTYRLLSLGMDPANPGRSLYIYAHTVCAIPILLGLAIIALALFAPGDPS